jgi:hypothetical protein
MSLSKPVSINIIRLYSLYARFPLEADRADHCCLHTRLSSRRLRRVPTEAARTSAGTGRRSSGERRRAVSVLWCHPRFAGIRPMPNESDNQRAQVAANDRAVAIQYLLTHR